MSEKALFDGMRVAIVPFPALGDLTIYLRLAQTFQRAGARVTYFSDQLQSAADHLPWLEVAALGAHQPERLCAAFDLVVWDAGVGNPAAQLAQTSRNLALVTSKRLPATMQSVTTSIDVAGRAFGMQCAAFCQDPDAGLSMVDWVDDYARRTFGLTAASGPPRFSGFPSGVGGGHRAAIFPTTPNPKKNYSTWGFRRIAGDLRSAGWDVSVLGVPAERDALARAYPDHEVQSFGSLGLLIEFLARCALVVSNDSGGGHLASMMGLYTVTITRKPANFVWRPGFGDRNTVLSPSLTFKAGGGHIWRPFIPFWRVKRIAAQVSVRLSSRHDTIVAES